MNRNLYGIMIKYPEPGRVKTRLAKDLGSEEAAEIYRRVTEQIMKNTAPAGQDYRRAVFYDPPERQEDFRSWFEHEELVPQQGNDVGQRMDNAIRQLLSLGAEKAVLTGTDIPGLNSTIITQAFAALDNADIVIGPAEDGGYYLIGMKEPHGELFRDIPWSTVQVYEQTLRAIEDGKLRCQSLITLSDLDIVSDYRRLLLKGLA
ncbi:MAG: TIGR04282 family arsenosugar biosynthesis glycosyltransferase [Nitrospirae bacterium]|nr:TIGR04282 family arsenosugar biosynthesis glycosyltransferase [Nitrospirota bacterium]